MSASISPASINEIGRDARRPFILVDLDPIGATSSAQRPFRKGYVDFNISPFSPDQLPFRMDTYVDFTQCPLPFPDDYVRPSRYVDFRSFGKILPDLERTKNYHDLPLAVEKELKRNDYWSWCFCGTAIFFFFSIFVVVF
ncbi:hypothetical protein PRIPAC_96053 [Pristionchus pacificus]|uniref:Uncharacterized protein n=1 Tax=Pristionchus pacificus TaxID=54126 RepID=A0A2A6BCQ0_PRIPA|nr:hypothetical protein PRIPAC_96053 [Pristionchus pacificus]|eukprot:PDM63670.1 hypothetical protein PRIPAC_49643 [Pristionchus pacificus]